MEELKLNKRRYLEIDLIRGICIILMIFDHFNFIVIKYSTFLWSNNGSHIKVFLYNFAFKMFNDFAYQRWIIRNIVVSFFFVISGICCTCSKNNTERCIKMGILALVLSIVTINLSNLFKINIRILWGIFHCYSFCLLINLMFEKIDKIYLIAPTAIFVFISILLNKFKPKLQFSNIFMPLGIPSNDFKYPIEYFPILQWLGIFFVGVLIGRYFYEILWEMPNMKKRCFNPVNFIGKNGAKIYFCHFPLLVGIIYLIGKF